nr:hypothetical protein [Tanacetum cinerariifolium]
MKAIREFDARRNFNLKSDNSYDIVSIAPQSNIHGPLGFLKWVWAIRGSRWFIFLGTLVTRCLMAIGPPIWITDDFEALVFGSEHDATDALSKLLQMGPMAEYQNIGVDEASSAIDGVFVIGESDVESMDVPRKFGEFLKNKESVEEVVVGGGEARGVDEYYSNRVILVLKEGGGELADSLDEINLGLSEEFVIRLLEGRHVSGEKSREVFSVTP